MGLASQTVAQINGPSTKIVTALEHEKMKLPIKISIEKQPPTDFTILKKIKATSEDKKEKTSKEPQGGVHGGGGGVINDDGKLKTLAEAGIIIKRLQTVIPKDYPDYCEITEATQKALDDVLVKLAPYFKEKVSLWPEQQSGVEIFRQEVLGSRDTFICVKSIDPKIFEGIKHDYAKVVKDAGFSFPSQNFELAAFALQGSPKTYILPNFDKLNDQQKALILIHEMFMRSTSEAYSTRLQKVLALDSAIYKALTETPNNQSTLEFLITANELMNITKNPKNFMLQIIQNTLSRPLLLSELMLRPDLIAVPNAEGADLKFDPSLIKKFEPVLRGIATILDSNYFIFSNDVVRKLYAGWMPYNFDASYLQQYLRNMCSAPSVMTLLNQSKVYGDKLVFIDPKSNDGFIFTCKDSYSILHGVFSAVAR